MVKAFRTRSLYLLPHTTQFTRPGASPGQPPLFFFRRHGDEGSGYSTPNDTNGSVLLVHARSGPTP